MSAEDMLRERTQSQTLAVALETLRRVWDWADQNADITFAGNANDALIVKDMIEDEFGGKP